MKKTRREFLALSGAGLLATSLPGGVSAMASLPSSNLSKFSFDLGIASYTFRKFSLEDTLAMTKRLGITRIGFKSFHLSLDASDELIASTVAKCNEAGINLYGGGVIYMKTKEEVDNAFEYARKAKMKMIIGVPGHELLSYSEGLTYLETENYKEAYNKFQEALEYDPEYENARIKAESIKPYTI